MSTTLVTGEGDLRAWMEATAARAYWLSHCEGFRVEGAEGRLGIVEEITESVHGEKLLTVRGGLLGRRVTTIPAGDVFQIVPRAMRIWLRSPLPAAASEPLAVCSPADEIGEPLWGRAAEPKGIPRLA